MKPFRAAFQPGATHTYFYLKWKLHDTCCVMYMNASSSTVIIEQIDELAALAWLVAATQTTKIPK